MEQREDLVSVRATRPFPWLGTLSALNTILIAALATLCVVLLNLLLVGRLSFFFDLCFVVICLGAGLLARQGEGWNVGLTPPMLLLMVVIFLSVLAPGTVAESQDSALQAVITAMTRHSTALISGYLLFLAALAWTVAQPQDSNRDGSPDPTRTTSG